MAIEPLEIKALVRIVDELNYYQLLHIERAASTSDVKQAFHSTSRTFHPDANRHLDDELRGHCARIAKRVTEAYSVLRDPRKRSSYDQKLEAGGGLRIQLAEAKAAHAKRETQIRQGRTPQGRQFFQKATQDLKRGNAPSAVNNLRMALTFEPDNAHFKQALREAQAQTKG